MNKKGIDYFPLEYNFWSDDKTLDIALNFPEHGEIIIIKLLSKIYNNEGYYCKWDNNSSKFFSNQFFYGNIEPEYIKKVIDRLLEINFFNKELYNKYNILTSYGIQKRFIFATKRRKNINYCIIQKEFEITYTMSTPCKHNVHIQSTECIHDVNTMSTSCAEKDSIVQDSIKKDSIVQDSIKKDKDSIGLKDNKDIVESKKQIPPLPNYENTNFKIEIPLDEDGCPDLTYYDTDEYKQKLAEMNNQSNSELTKKEPKKFIPPTKEEILCFANEKKLDNYVDAFFDYYESNGWRVGKNKMAKWKNAYSGWVSRNKKHSNKTKQDSLNNYQSNRYVNNDFENVTYETVYNTD